MLPRSKAKVKIMPRTAKALCLIDVVRRRCSLNMRSQFGLHGPTRPRHGSSPRSMRRSQASDRRLAWTESCDHRTPDQLGQSAIPSCRMAKSAWRSWRGTRGRGGSEQSEGMPGSIVPSGRSSAMWQIGRLRELGWTKSRLDRHAASEVTHGRGPCLGGRPSIRTAPQ